MDLLVTLLLGEIDSKFLRNYYLPTILFYILGIFLLDSFKVTYFWTYLSLNNIGLLSAMIALISIFAWLTSITLMGGSSAMYRILEGYGRLNPLRSLRRFQEKKFKTIKNEIETLDKQYVEYNDQNKNLPADFRMKRNQLYRMLVTRYPDDEIWLLPTSFGNSIRAFEIYPRVMYGIDAIEGWSRLMAIIPSEFLNQINDSRANVAFWVNSLFLQGFALLGYVILVLYTKIWLYRFFSIIVVISMIASYNQATNSVIGWGTMFKAAFDVFLPDLCKKKIGFEVPETKIDKHKLWTEFSQAVIYLRPDIMPDRKALHKVIEDKDKL